MKLEKSLYQKGYIYFLIFFLFMLWGFWLTYFTRIPDQENYRMHLHGIALILWCIMLVIQPYLIRAKKVRIHRRLGKLSYVLVPFMVYTTVDLFTYRLQAKDPLPVEDVFAVALILNALVVFVVLYGLAIYHRERGPIHARYMLSTAFPMFTPITDRIISMYFPSVLDYLPKVGDFPNVVIIGFAMADVILLILCIWDWRSHKRWNVFPFVLLLLLAYHASVLTLYKYPFWITFSTWFASL